MDGSIWSPEITYELIYNKLGRVEELKQTSHEGVATTRTVDFLYDQIGNPIGEKVISSGLGLLNQLDLKSNYLTGYNNKNCYASSISNNGIAIAISEIDFAGFSNKLIQKNQSGSVNRVSEYKKDFLSRLSEINYDSGLSIENKKYNREFSGNITSINGSAIVYDGSNRLKTKDGLTYSYNRISGIEKVTSSGGIVDSYIYQDVSVNPGDNMRVLSVKYNDSTTFNYSHDQQGNVNSIKRHNDFLNVDINHFDTMKYNSLNQLVEVSYLSCDNGTKCVDKYYYDQTGLRFKKEEFQAPYYPITNITVDSKIITVIDPSLNKLDTLEGKEVIPYKNDHPYISDNSKLIHKNTTYYLYAGNNILLEEKYNSSDAIVEAQRNVILGDKVVSTYTFKP